MAEHARLVGLAAERADLLLGGGVVERRQDPGGLPLGLVALARRFGVAVCVRGRGAVLVLVGVLMLTGQFTRLATFFYEVMPAWLTL